jgi:AcrR family transcriptional regulator
MHQRANPVRSRSAPEATGSDLAARERILEAFAERAKRSGIRSVVMGELAGELRMSATTLYQHCPSKEDLVTATVERWAADVAQREAAMLREGERLSPTDRMLRWAHCWAEAVSQYSVAFWDDLRWRYPQAWKVFSEEIERRKKEGAAQLRPRIRARVNSEVALAVLDLIMRYVPNPRLCDRIGVSRKEAIETALAVWAWGALDKAAAKSERRSSRLVRLEGGKRAVARSTT